MKRGVKLAVACVAMLVATAGQLKASLIIIYQDIGSDLRFDYSGSLGVAANGNSFQAFATVSNQSGNPVFYSTGDSGDYGFAGSSALTQTSGPFATNLPAFASVQGTTTGTSFMFRLNGGIPDPASSISIWGNWGSANSPIVGQLIITDQSAASLGLVNGWQVTTTEWGSITFTAIPEPSSLVLCGIVACFACLPAVSRRRPEKQL